MKKFLLIITIMIGVIGGLTQDSLLWSYRLFLDEPVVHQVRKGEYLSKLSKAYYGSPEYWRELALINRAPNPDLVHPEEGLLIPDLTAIKRLRAARTSTEVNALVREIEETIQPDAAVAVIEPDALPATDSIFAGESRTQADLIQSPRVTAEKPPEKYGSAWLIGLMIIGFLGLLGLGWFYFFRRKPSETTYDRDTDVGEPQSESKSNPENTGGRRKKVNMEEALMLD